MSNDETVNETCSCGSSFQYSGGYASANVALWRKSHRHESQPSTSRRSDEARTIALTGTYHDTGYVDLGFTTGGER